MGRWFLISRVWVGWKIKINTGAIIGHMRAEIKILADRGGWGVVVEALGGGYG